MPSGRHCTNVAGEKIGFAEHYQSIDEPATLAVNVEFSTPASTQARARFSASSRQVEVTGAGEMKWEAGRAYYGRWQVYWSK